MVGNIYTSYNDLAATIAELAFQGGALRPMVATVAISTYSLQDHLNRPASVAAIENPTVTRLVIQQGPTETDQERADLIEYSGQIAGLVAERETPVGLYVVWPHFNADINTTIANYTAAANANSLGLFPVGHAFRTILQQYPDIALYESDLVRPSRHGSFLAAMVITAVIFDQDPTQYPNLFPAFITPEELVHLKAAAKSAVIAYGRD